MVEPTPLKNIISQIGTLPPMPNRGEHKKLFETTSGPVEDVFPIEHEDFPASHVS